MSRLPRIALVGEPSTGKSTLFNRLVKERKAIVGQTRGITRDRLYGRGEWLDTQFTVIDTGGITVDDAPFTEQIKAQAEIAVKEADVIVFLVDGRRGVTDDTLLVARILRPYRNRVILCCNKIDDQTLIGGAYDFYSLGFGDPVLAAADKAIGVGDLLDECVKRFPKDLDTDIDQEDEAIRFAVIGRPNVGKSSLVNILLGSERVVVSPVAGTTRDAVDTRFTRDGVEYLAVDTAGLNKRGKIYESIDRYAALRALDAVDKARIVVALIDSSQALTAQDAHIVGIAAESDKPLVICVSKWDLHSHGIKDQDQYRSQIYAQMPFVSHAPVVFTSAVEKRGINRLFEAIELVNREAGKRVPTSLLNSVVADAQTANETPLYHGGRLRINYATQVAVYPPTFVLFVNNPDFMHFSYLRYLEKTFRTQFDMENTPVKIITRTKQTGGFKL